MIQLGLTIGTILTIVASFLPHFRCCNVVIWTFGNIAHLVGLLMLTMFRYGDETEMCATAESAEEAGRKVDQLAIDEAAFLRTIITVMWVCIFIHWCAVCCNIVPCKKPVK